jgi:arylsulfatase A-like enzyme
MAMLNAGLVKRFGEGTWAIAMSANSVVLNRLLISQRKVMLNDVYEEGRRLLLAQPGIAAVYNRAELQSGSRQGSPLFESMRNSWNAERSGDLQIAPKPYWMFGTGHVTTHGSPYAYDTNVPLLIYGPAWVRAGRIDARVEMADVAPTLAQLLGVPAPSSCEGKPLPLEAPRN